MVINAEQLSGSLDRIYSLQNAAANPGSNFLDQVLYFPCKSGTIPLRMWLGTNAVEPEIEIDEVRFQSVSGKSDGWRWVDFGEIKLPFLKERGFGIIRYFGISPAQAQDSWLVITVQTNLSLCGKINDVEKQLWGLCREDAGTTTITPSSVTVGSPTVFTVTYQAGTKGLPSGALLKFFVPKAFAEPQWDYPENDGYVRLNESDTPIDRVVIRPSVDSHQKYEIIYRLPQGLTPVGKTVISYRTDYTYIHASKFADVDLLYWFMNYPPLRTMVAVNEKKSFVPLLKNNSHQVEFTPGSPERLFLFLPGRRRSGAKIELKGLITDHYRNLPDIVCSPRFHLVISGHEKIRLNQPKFSGKSTFSLTLPELKPGIYRIKAIDNDNGTILAVSNPLQIISPDSKLEEVFWGEIHGHSEASDGSGGFAEMLCQARDCFALDFAASGDHACYFSDNEWEWMQDVTNSFNTTGRFCTLIGYEWAGEQGHRNIYTSRPRLPRYRGMQPSTNRLETVYTKFTGDYEVVAGPHTHHTGDFWKYHQPEVERFFEIYSMWGEFDHLAEKLLSEGAVIGFTGGGDCHEGRVGLSVEDPERHKKVPHSFVDSMRHKCGLTAAVMAELSRPALIKALREHSTYATSGARILLDFAISGFPMGTVAKAEKIGVSFEVHACAEIADVKLIKDGEPIKVFDGQGLDMADSWNDIINDCDRHWYYLKVTQVDGDKAWSSPIWINAASME